MADVVVPVDQQGMQLGLVGDQFRKLAARDIR
jgi:hypothetical protein